jgi:hypothetical protein
VFALGKGKLMSLDFLAEVWSKFIELENITIENEDGSLTAFQCFLTDEESEDWKIPFVAMIVGNGSTSVVNVCIFQMDGEQVVASDVNELYLPIIEKFRSLLDSEISKLHN